MITGKIWHARWSGKGLKREKGGRDGSPSGYDPDVCPLRPPIPLPERDCQAAIFTFSAASATRFEIGWATSPASLSIASVEREPSATIMSTALRT